MSTARIRNLSIVVGLVLAVGLAVTLGAFTRNSSDREVTLYARGMAFYLPGSDAPNPTLRVVAGERVEITVVNDDPGVRHDLVVDALKLRIAPLAATQGSRGTATLEAPALPGRYAYVCTFHAQMMRGTLEVVAAR